MSEEYGGRVELAKTYYKGISKSLAKNFNGTGLISSMQQCNDFFFLGTEQISMGRVGMNFSKSNYYITIVSLCPLLRHPNQLMHTSTNYETLK